MNDHTDNIKKNYDALAVTILCAAVVAVLLIPFFTLVLHELVFRDVVFIGLASLTSVITGISSLLRLRSKRQSGSRIAIMQKLELDMEFPGKTKIQDPIMDLRYEIEIESQPNVIWPWIKQLGYHRGGWYIDTWWDKVIQEHFWPRVVPKEARGTFKPPAMEILPEHQNLTKGDIVPDGPPGTAYYEVVDIQENRLLVLYASSHFKYIAPQYVYKTRFAPRGGFCWAFMLEDINERKSKLISWWQAEIQPRQFFFLIKPVFGFVDRVHQVEILKGIKRRVEKNAS